MNGNKNRIAKIAVGSIGMVTACSMMLASLGAAKAKSEGTVTESNTVKTVLGVVSTVFASLTLGYTSYQLITAKADDPADEMFDQTIGKIVNFGA
jgi:hypothetical protein